MQQHTYARTRTRTRTHIRKTHQHLRVREDSTGLVSEEVAIPDAEQRQQQRHIVKYVGVAGIHVHVVCALLTQHTSAYVSIRQHTSGVAGIHIHVLCALLSRRVLV
jgi:hypothetical protein